MIGGGLGGLAAAARLARLRHEVVLVEATEILGGMLGRHSRGDHAWDTGPTFLTLPAALRDLFLKTGKPLETVVDLVALDPVAHYRFGDGTTLDIPNTGVGDVSAAFDSTLGGTTGRDWERFHEHAARVWALMRAPLLEGPQPTGRDVLGLALRHPRQVAPGRSLRRVARRFLTDPRQRVFVERYAADAGSDPRVAPAVLAVLPYVEHTFRSWRVVGGMRRLVDALHARAVERGVTVQTGVAATGVSTAAGRVDGVRLADGRRLPADVVVSDVDVSVLFRDLLPDARSAQAVAPATRTPSVFTLFLGLRGTTPDVRRHNVLLPTDYEADLDAVFGRHAAPSADPTLHVHVSRDEGDAPAGGEAWTVSVNAPRHCAGSGAVDWDAAGVAGGYAQQLLDRLAATGLDVRGRIVVADHWSPADVERRTGSPGGSAYGFSTTGLRGALARPANRSALPGLFLVGGSAHPGGGVAQVTMSAALVADLVGRA